MTMLSQAETLLQTTFERLNAPSMIGAIIHEGQLQLVLESGDATRASRFRLGTLTQTLTAYAILQHLTPDQLHQPINTYIRLRRSAVIISIGQKYHRSTHPSTDTRSDYILSRDAQSTGQSG
jgi:hypothetical protein